MSHFFIGQLLVFACLTPVLLQPYIRPLRELQAIPLLAPIAAAVCAGTAASGLRVLFFPLFIFALAVLALAVPDLILLARGADLQFARDAKADPLAQDSAAPNIAALVILAALLAVCACFQPEFSYSPTNDIKRTTERASLSAGFSYRFNVFEIIKDEDELELEDDEQELQKSAPSAVLYFPSFPAGVSGRDTLLAMAADRGIAAVAVHWSGKQLYSSSSMNPEALRDLRQVAYAFGQSFKPAGAEAPYVTRFARAQESVMQTVILDAARFARERFSQKEGAEDLRLFAVAEGYACTSLAAVVADHPKLFAGAAYLLSENDAMNLNMSGAASYSLRSLDETLPNGAADFAQLVVTDGRAGALGLCEMPADDPALAALLRIRRDSGRRLARLTAERVLYWVEARSSRLGPQG